MIVVTIEIYPFGNESNKRELSKVLIINDGKHPDRPEYGSYTIMLVEPGMKDMMAEPKLSTTLNAFHRGRGHLALVSEALLKLEMVE